MSGGSLDYCQYRFLEVADKIDRYVGAEMINHQEDWSEEVLIMLRLASLYCRKAAIFAHEAEWLFSCDTGPDTFLKNIRAEIEKNGFTL